MGTLETWLDWELGLWTAVRKLWGATDRPPVPPGAVSFTSLDGRLCAFAAFIAGGPIALSGSAHAGGIRVDGVLLPEYLAVSDDEQLNVRAWIVRTAIDATTWKRLHHRRDGWDEGNSLSEAQQSFQALTEHFPQFLSHWEQVCAGAPALQPPFFGRLLRFESTNAGVVSPQPDPAAIQTEAKAPAPEDVHVLSVDEENVKEVPIHVFEKVETVEAFSGSLRQLDGEDDLDDHLEGLREIDLSSLIRGGPAVHSMLRADIALEANIPDVETVDSDEKYLTFPEWDRTRYRPDWCRVYPTRFDARDPQWSAESRLRLHRVILPLRQQLERLSLRRTSVPRRLEGDQLDVDAWVSGFGDRLAGKNPDPRLFIGRLPREPDVAWLALFDLSLSTDSYVDGVRVLDVARDLVFALGEALDQCGHVLEIFGFASKTRNCIRSYAIRTRDEPWSVGAARLGAARPVGYTRIGPALRHATAHILQAPKRQRVIFLVSDCKPTDYDRYEGSYGLADVQRAIQEARAKGVHVHALTVDSAARTHVASMLGSGSWGMVSKADHLLKAMNPLLSALR